MCIKSYHVLITKWCNFCYFLPCNLFYDQFINCDHIQVFAWVFLDLSIMSFPKLVNMTKNTPLFSNFAHICTPKRCTRVNSCSWKRTLIMWIFLRGWYPTSNTSGPPGPRPATLKIFVRNNQGNLKGESAVAAILPSRMEASFCTSRFFRS